MVLRAFLPYPDLPRRVRIRHRAFTLISLRQWPGDDAATGADAAQLALLRALEIQRRIRRAVRWRRRDEAALLARSAIDNVIVGLYCLHHPDAVTKLSAAENLAGRRATAYLSRSGIVSKETIISGLDALGERGPDLNLKEAAEWLNNEKGLLIAINLYEAYYSPLSHFFPHSSGFALMRHVRPNGKLRRRPHFPWVRRSAARIADGCAGLMATAIAAKAGSPASHLIRYTDAHLGRALNPTFIVAINGWRQAILSFPPNRGGLAYAASSVAEFS